MTPGPALPTYLLSQLLRDVPLFARLPQESRTCLGALDAGEVLCAAPGEALCARGDPPALVIVVRGHVRSTPPPPPRAMAGCFGAVELLTGQAMGVAVHAIDEVIAYRLSPDAFFAVVHTCPGFARQLLAALARQIDTPAESTDNDRA